MRPVVEPEPLMVTTCAGDHGQHVRIHLRAGRWHPSMCDPKALTRWRNREGAPAAASPARVPRSPRCRRSSHWLRYAVRSRSPPPPRRRAAAAAACRRRRAGTSCHAWSRLDRIAEPANPVHVGADGAGGDAEPGGELGAGPVAPGLQHGQQAQQPGGRFQHSVDPADNLGTNLSYIVPSLSA